MSTTLLLSSYSLQPLDITVALYFAEVQPDFAEIGEVVLDFLSLSGVYMVALHASQLSLVNLLFDNIGLIKNSYVEVDKIVKSVV